MIAGGTPSLPLPHLLTLLSLAGAAVLACGTGLSVAWLLSAAILVTTMQAAEERMPEERVSQHGELVDGGRARIVTQTLRKIAATDGDVWKMVEGLAPTVTVAEPDTLEPQELVPILGRAAMRRTSVTAMANPWILTLGPTLDSDDNAAVSSFGQKGGILRLTVDYTSARIRGESLLRNYIWRPLILVPFPQTVAAGQYSIEVTWRCIDRPANGVKLPDPIALNAELLFAFSSARNETNQNRITVPQVCVGHPRILDEARVAFEARPDPSQSIAIQTLPALPVGIVSVFLRETMTNGVRTFALTFHSKDGSTACVLPLAAARAWCRDNTITPFSSRVRERNRLLWCDLRDDNTVLINAINPGVGNLRVIAPGALLRPNDMFAIAEGRCALDTTGERLAAWEPDGRIAFGLPDASGRRMVSLAWRWSWIRQLAWSPTEAEVAFVGTPRDGPWAGEEAVYVACPDGAVSRLYRTSSSALHVVALSWRADGGAVLLTTARQPGRLSVGHGGVHPDAILICARANGAVETVVEHGNIAWFSPDGRHIALTTPRLLGGATLRIVSRQSNGDWKGTIAIEGNSRQRPAEPAGWIGTGRRFAYGLQGDGGLHLLDAISGTEDIFPLPAGSYGKDLLLVTETTAKGEKQ